MKYYLVALFDHDSYKAIETIQRNVTKKYKIYKSYPTLHIPLEVIDNVEFDELDSIIEKVIKPYKKFKVEVNDNIYFDNLHKCISMKITNKGYIKKISRSINDMFKLHGFNLKENSNKKDLYISLSNVNFLPRDSRCLENGISCNNLRGCKFNDTIKIDRIELWKSTNNRKDCLVKSYVLKNF